MLRLFDLPPDDGHALLAPLAGPATLVTAAAPDGHRLRRLLNTAQAATRHSASTHSEP
ncbi:hypothetical protein [Streptomyces rimosus]|uniref:hypothetical protein n=1 Tax=Streptomyces rimosus TaxID=1927 RepID=UPI000AC815A1|nr:hypothetical protein [Streptomyces rimosus]